MKFKITLGRDIQQWAEVIVEAPTKEEADALGKIDSELNWEEDHRNGRPDPFIVETEEATEDDEP